MYNRILLSERLLTNITILVPNGTTQHGNERLLCLPVTSNYWPSISAVIVFFAANYLAHAATVKSSPGDGILVQACNAFLALMFPMSGLLRALNAISRYSKSAQTELEKACNAGALCMVVRDRHWRPSASSSLRIGVKHRLGNESDIDIVTSELITYLPTYAREDSSSWIHFDSVWAQSYVDPSLKRIHGTHKFADGYTFAIVPRDTVLFSTKDSHDDKGTVSDLSASKSCLKAVASIVQIIAAFTTLLSHRSDLVDQWGYASYHLTVLPYLFMTLVNLISNLVIADYPCLYMVRTDAMTEAESFGGRFDGEVARTETLADEDDDLVGCIPYDGVTNEGIVAFITSFTPGMALLWQFTIPLHILAIPLYIHEMVKARTSSIVQLTAIDLKICRDPTDLNPEQVCTSLMTTLMIPTSQTSPIRNQPSDTQAIEIETHAAEEECLIEDQPTSSFFEAKSSLYRYRIQVRDPPQILPIHAIRSMLRSAMDGNAKRARWPARSSSKSIPTMLKRALMMWLEACGTPRMMLKIMREEVLSIKPDPETSNTATFYYPSCARFLRASTPNNHTMLYIDETTSNEPPTNVVGGRPVISSRSKSKSRTRWGFLVEMVTGSMLVGCFFGIIAALTHFQPGHSSATERGIMMAWLASGLYGFCLPFLGTIELFRVFFLLPLVSIAGPTFSSRDGRAELKRILELKLRWRIVKLVLWYLRGWLFVSFPMQVVLSFVPLAIFIPPIWGFVLVGRMLLEWGNCTRLY